MSPRHSRLSRAPRTGGRGPTVLTALVGFYLVQSAYLGAESSPNLVYVGSVLFHTFGGLGLAVVACVLGRRALRALRQDDAVARAAEASNEDDGFQRHTTSRASSARAAIIFALLFLLAATASAVMLIVMHNTRDTRWLLLTHIVLGVAAALLGWIAVMAVARQWPALRGMARTFGAFATVAAALAFVLPFARESRVSETYTIRNPERPPFDMNEEAMHGSEGPFFPSSAYTSTGGRIPSTFFMTSESCKRCHGDIYDQWEQSAHHFSSFNNQWYRKSIEYMQEANGVTASKWCAGCHDHAVLFNGMMDEPVETFLHTQEAHTGLGCNSCHAITHVRDTMGNGGFYVEYPPMHDLAVSENPVLRWVHDFVVQVDPGPHRDTFLKPFHREQTAEFCSSCHKVHLDVPVNNYRWIRGFNTYDNWQASGVSGEGARSFYYPAKPMDCADCHMPLRQSDDKGNIDGFVHDHSFVAANTAVPAANLHERQLADVIDFLQNGQLRVDIFAAGTARPQDRSTSPSGDLEAGTGAQPQIASTFAVGEEGGVSVGSGRVGAQRELQPVWAPLGEVDFAAHRGEELRIDVVVRTLTIGHFFPTGTIDGFDVWLELRATDETGRPIFWNGLVHDGGTGPVDEGAHFYGVKMVDARGNPINKRNAWATRAVAWVNLIPPGAADVAHYRLQIPEDCGERIFLDARVNYRKFQDILTEFSFGGDVAEGEPRNVETGGDRLTKHYDDREFVTKTPPMNVSAVLHEIPDLPIVVLSRDTLSVRVVDGGHDRPPMSGTPSPKHFGVWNDYGIGLLRQGDFQGARRAFRRTVEANPQYADGFVNLARVALEEGLLDDAVEALDKAEALDPVLAKTQFFRGLVHKERGEYPQALERFAAAAAQYPNDRVVRNETGRVLFLQRRFAEAVAEFEHVLSIDAEDLTAHYNLMLCYKGLGREEEAQAERRLYERFKADEDAQAILGPVLRANPEDNRMRQPIHEQRSAAPDVIAREIRLRDLQGDPHVVLPGQGKEYAARLIARGNDKLAAGGGAKRFLGPTEEGVVRPTLPRALRRAEGMAQDGPTSTDPD